MKDYRSVCNRFNNSRFILQHFTKTTYRVIAIVLLFVIFYVINTINYNNWRIGNWQASIFIGESKTGKNFATIQKSYSDTVKNMKYILLWTNPTNSPFINFGEGRSLFINKSCSWNNCYVTSDRNFLGDYTEFEAIAFNGPELFEFAYKNDLPKRRRSHQKYVYANIEGAGNYPICTKFWNNFFNWTWTYKMDSDIFWPYFSIRDKMNNFIGPQKNMNWINLVDMDPIDESLKVSLVMKNSTAAWFVSNCDTQSLREIFVQDLQEQMRPYKLQLDIYGVCGDHKCPHKMMDKCQKMLESQYYFYLAFENSLSEDYVTEKILHALNHNVIPVVLGDANYSRFMPKGIYLNALELGPRELASKMFEIIQNPKLYFDFFRWKKYYSYHFTHESPETDVYCRFCEYLNNDSLRKKKTIYKQFNKWWTPEKYCLDKKSIKLQ